MLRKDYIVRQLEEFGKVLALAIGYRRKKEFENFEACLKEAEQKFLSLKIGEAEKASSAELQALTEKLLPEEVKMLADLMFERWLLLIELNEDKAAERLRKNCLQLYQYFMLQLTQNEFNLDAHYKIEWLSQKSIE